MTKPPVLPEKEWFTLEEIAQRWGTQAEALIHYGHFGQLEIRTYWPSTDLSLAALTTRPDFILSRDLLGQVERNGVCNIRARNLRPVEDPKAANRPLEKIAPKKLFVTRLERDRFEQEHRVGAHARAMPDPDRVDKLDPRIERTYLQIIRVMSAELKLPSEQYKAAKILEIYAANHGCSWPTKPDTVAKKLKAAWVLED